MNRPGTLTPVAFSPLPFENSPSIPMVSLVEPPTLNSTRLVTLPSTSSLVTFPSLGSFESTMLADNEIGDLRWNRSNPPRPAEITSSYRRIGCIGDGSCFFHAVAKGLSEVYQQTYQKFNNITEGTLRHFESSVSNNIIFPSTLFTTFRSQNPNQVYAFVQPYGQDAFNDLLSQYRRIYIKMLRQDFANLILNDRRMQSLILQRLSNSITLRMDEIIDADSLKVHVPFREKVQNQAFQDVLRNLAQELLNGDAVKPDFILLLSDYANIDIYLLNDEFLINPNLTDTVTPLYGDSIHAAIHGPVNMRPEGDIYSREPNRRAIVIISIDDVHYEIVARIDGPEGNGGERNINANMSQDEPLITRLYEMVMLLRLLNKN